MKKELYQALITIPKQIRAFLSETYLKKKLAKRRGNCRKCGACCRGCPQLNKKTKLCKVYFNRPRIMCYKEFPLDNQDQKLWGVEKFCGYRFKE